MSRDVGDKIKRLEASPRDDPVGMRMGVEKVAEGLHRWTGGAGYIGLAVSQEGMPDSDVTEIVFLVDLEEPLSLQIVPGNPVCQQRFEEVARGGRRALPPMS
jgi:hypothetical protein